MPPSKGKGNGKKKGKGKGSSKKTKNTLSDPTSSCIFPREIISNILSRLPVKTLLRFRCVCKPWQKLISKPNFIATHFRHSSSLPSVPCTSPIFIHTRHFKSFDHVLSLFDPHPESSPVVELDSPFPSYFQDMLVVGCCNGIVCLSQPPWGEMITLWNPAMRQYRTIKLSKTKPLMGIHSCVSVGLAYDSQENDFLILSLLCFRPAETRAPDEVEMCSTKSFSWKKLKNEVGFRVLGLICNVIIKGVPYWRAIVEDAHGSREVLVYFDVSKKVFDKLPTPGIRVGTKGYLVNLEDSLGMLIWEKTDKYNVNVWVMDDEDGWSKKCNVGITFGFDRTLGCLRNGDIVVEDENGVLLFDPVTSSVKAKFSIENAKKGSYVIFDYSESLVLIGGMLPVKKEAAEDKLAREYLLKAGINMKVFTTKNPQQAAFATSIA
ncbi:putative F-box protein At1g32420 isoform X1 [Nicotiana sylvestris]|uniref:F-box/kelch-repeat protein At3g23880-like isoform X1 n=1 Tax=Nicotiana sylvestris TaxID=4096 RepID=A0A1U7YKS2_NICSY|nr:PREDICTED: F-box/kelch-repeat protein At3g23880-like isoform X1 [Nicotiana sylvestris]